MNKLKYLRPWMAIAFLILLAPGWANSASNTGVVKPRVTIIKPTSMSEGQIGREDAHKEHAPEATAHEDVKPVIDDYALPVKYSAPYAITTDSKGIIWFTEMSNHSVARLDPATGELKEYRLPSAEGLPDPEWDYDPNTKLTTPQSYDVYSVGNPGAIAVDKNDVIWFVTLLGNSVVRFDPVKEEFTEFMVPSDHAQPYDLAPDADGRVWFVEKNTGKIGYVLAGDQRMVEIDLESGANPMGIILDKKGMVWIGDVPGNFLGRYDPATQKLKKFPINVANSQPGQMRFDHLGNLWVCMLHSQQLGVLIPEPGVYSVVPLPGYNAVPQALAPDAKGRIWIVDSMTNQIGFFDSINLNWRLFEIPVSNSQPMGITVDSSGDVWFTQSDRHANRISRLRISSIESHDAHAGHDMGKAPATTATEAPAAGGGSMITLIILTLVAIGALVGGIILARKLRP
ncbi:MAG: hypothetical protein OEV92_04140 [Nitrospinota bacterium]|nr:hypothetical protein [Nitrospinota bacterium]